MNKEELPIGISQWREHGIKYGYSDFFENEMDAVEKKLEARREGYLAALDAVSKEVPEILGETSRTWIEWSDCRAKILSTITKLRKQK